MNKCKTRKIHPILSDNEFIIDCKDKATIFARFFTQQCQPLFNGSTLPRFSHLTNSRFDHVTISSGEIPSPIRPLNKVKASGPDNVSSHMLILCDNTVTLPLKIIFEQIVASSIYPETGKLANITPFHKEGDK